MSINGHFSHYDAIPADINSETLYAQRLLTPTLDPTAPSPTHAYFMMPLTGSGSLVYSVGCHSGLSVLDGSIAAGLPRYQADWPNAAIKQGGNWVGNTGYGYGDSDLVGYSERLSLLFTEALGRDIRTGQEVLYRPDDRRIAGARQARVCPHIGAARVLQRLRRKSDQPDDTVWPVVYQDARAEPDAAALQRLV